MYEIETAMRLALIAEREMEDIANDEDAVLNPLRERITTLRSEIASFGEPQCGKPGRGFKALEKLQRELAAQEEDIREYEDSFYATGGATAHARYNQDMQLWGSKYFSSDELKETRDRPIKAANALYNQGKAAVIAALNEGIAASIREGSSESGREQMKAAIEFFASK